MDEQAKPLSKTVLCIDDNADVLHTEKSLLQAAGYEVLIAKSGAEGITVAGNREIDLVVVDYEMPRILGTEVARRLRAMQPTLPIIMVSGALFPEEAAQVVDCFLPKAAIGKLASEVDRLTDPANVCAFCRLPVSDLHKPAVSLAKGENVHVECYVKMIEQR